jgi:hypothetical protein
MPDRIGDRTRAASNPDSGRELSQAFVRRRRRLLPEMIFAHFSRGALELHQH